MELPEELPTDIQLCRTITHVIVTVTYQEKHCEGTLLEPAAPDLFGSCIVGIVDADESGLTAELVKHILKRIDAATGTWEKGVGLGQLVFLGQLLEIGMAVKEFTCVHFALILEFEYRVLWHPALSKPASSPFARPPFLL